MITDTELGKLGNCRHAQFALGMSVPCLLGAEDLGLSPPSHSMVCSYCRLPSRQIRLECEV